MDIAAIAGTDMLPFGISNAGIIVGQSGRRGVVIANGNLTYLDIPETRLTGINPSGTLCVGTHFEQEREISFVYSLLDGSIRYLPVLGGIDYWTSASGINGSGLVVGSYYFGGSEAKTGEAFVVQGEELHAFRAPGAHYTEFGG